MVVLSNDGKRRLRRPSMKGGVSMSVNRGNELATSWPLPRGRNLTQKTKDQMEWFRQAQLATKLVSPDQMFLFEQTTKGSPILPRDMFTMMWSGRMLNIAMRDGRMVWPRCAMNDVSTSLDTITQTPGYTLIRQADEWAGIPYSAPPEGGLVLLDQVILTATANSVFFNNINQTLGDLMISTTMRLTGNTAPKLRMRFNGDNGANYATREWNLYGVGFGAADSSLGIGSAAPSTSPAHCADQCEVVIPGYSRATWYKGASSTVALFEDNGGLIIPEIYMGLWRNQSAITDIELFCIGGTFAIGSFASLYARGVQ